MQKNITNYFFHASILTIVIGIFFVTNFFPPQANGQLILDNQTRPEVLTSADSAQLLETPVFKTDDQSTILVRPTFNDKSTNIAFYMKCPSEACPNDGTIESPVYIFSAENLGHGTLPFSDYWAPPFPSDYIAIEYKNDEQQFSCSGISFDECLSDPHFVKVFHFSLVDNATEIIPEILALKAELNNKGKVTIDTATSTASNALLQLSISLSSTSISSNLDNGLIVTASLDGIASIATSSIFDTNTTTSTETDISTSTKVDIGSSIGSFLMDIVDSVIEIFTPEETILIEPISEEPAQPETIFAEPIQSEPSPELPTVETPISESAQENEVQSSISAKDIINDEIITTEF